MMLVGFCALVWVPLVNKETIWVMQEVTVRIVNVAKSVRFGLSKFDHGKNH